MPHLGHKVPDAEGSVDLEAFEASVEVCDLRRGGFTLKHLLGLRQAHPLAGLGTGSGSPDGSAFTAISQEASREAGLDQLPKCLVMRELQISVLDVLGESLRHSRLQGALISIAPPRS